KRFHPMVVWSLAMFACITLRAAPAKAPERPLLNPLFCDHAVLQRDVAVPVWGWTKPAAKITLTFGDQRRVVIADAKGNWRTTLRPMAASSEPRTLTVASSDGQSTTASDVLIGDVWLCSGQSNMEMGIELCNATNDIATADIPRLRLLTVPHKISA